MARNSMAWLIMFLRVKVNDTDSSVWTDDQLQDYLDMHRMHVRREKLSKDANEKVYLSQFGMFEDDVSLWNGNSAYAVEVPFSQYATDLVDGMFIFAEDQNNEYYLDGKSYNIHGAISECLEQLAMNPNKAREWERGGVKYTHYDYVEMAKYHRNFSGAKNTRVTRGYR